MSMKVYCQYTIIQTKRRRRGNLAILAWLSNSRKWLWKDEIAELMTENESKSNPRTHEQVRFDRCHLLFEEYMQWKLHQFTILKYASKQANVLKNVYEEEKKLRTWNYLNLAFVWYKELCRSRRLLLRLYSICIILHIILSLFNNYWIFINNQNRVLKMLGFMGLVVGYIIGVVGGRGLQKWKTSRVHTKNFNHFLRTFQGPHSIFKDYLTRN